MYGLSFTAITRRMLYDCFVQHVRDWSSLRYFICIFRLIWALVRTSPKLTCTKCYVHCWYAFARLIGQTKTIWHRHHRLLSPRTPRYTTLGTSKVQVEELYLLCNLVVNSWCSRKLYSVLDHNCYCNTTWAKIPRHQTQDCINVLSKCLSLLFTPYQ